MVHVVVMIFALLLVLSLCGLVGAILWLVVRRGHTLTAHDLIPLVGFALSGLVSFTVFSISHAPQKVPPMVPPMVLPTGLMLPILTASPSPTPSATP